MAKSNAPGGDTPQTISLQLAMAFGQGAGTTPATSAALLEAYNAYQPAFERRAGEWPEIELRSLEYGRALGRLSAHAAASNGRAVIDSEDVRAALDVVRRNRLRPLLECHLTPGKIRRPGGDPVKPKPPNR